MPIPISKDQLLKKNGPLSLIYKELQNIRIRSESKRYWKNLETCYVLMIVESRFQLDTTMIEDAMGHCLLLMLLEVSHSYGNARRSIAAIG